MEVKRCTVEGNKIPPVRPGFYSFLMVTVMCYRGDRHSKLNDRIARELRDAESCGRCHPLRQFRGLDLYSRLWGWACGSASRALVQCIRKPALCFPSSTQSRGGSWNLGDREGVSEV